MQQVAHLGVLGVHVELVLLVAGHLDRFAVNDADAETIQAVDLSGVVGHQDEVVDAQVGQDRGTRAVLAEVGSKAESEVGFDGVHALILKGISAQFIDETDAAALLTEVEQDAATTFFDAAQGFGQLFATVATETAKGIARQALRVHTTEDRFGGGDIALDQSDMVFARHLVDISVGTESTILGRQFGDRNLLDKFLGVTTIGDKVGDGNLDQIMLLGKLQEFGGTHHGTVLAHDFAAETALLETRQTAEIDGGLGVTRAHQDTAIARLEREHVTRTAEVGGFHAIGHCGAGRDTTFDSRDTCGR